jgi:basic membrane protein A
MRKPIFWLITILIISALLSACGAMAQPETAAPAAQTVEKYGLVAGNIEDGGFNQLAWAGMQQAADELGVEVEHVEVSDAASNAEEAIAQLVDEGVDGIITVGFGLSAAAKAASEANPDIAFAGVDTPSLTDTDLGLLFDVDAPSFMAGYLAAGMSQSGVVCTFGGQQTPPVMAFMVGFEHGVDYYNRQNAAAVSLLGWETNPLLAVGGEGVFAGTFTDSEVGRQLAEDFFSQDCDVIFPVAGAAGLGADETALEQGLMSIGVDADQTQTTPDLADVYLTSVVKQVDVAVFETIKSIHEGNFVGGENFIGTLENDGVGLAPFNEFESVVPDDLKADLARIEQGLTTGTISTGWPIYAVTTVRRLTEDVLLNAVYPSEFTVDGLAPLQDGIYEEPVPDSAATAYIEALPETIAFGDLDADGVEDAAIVLMSEGGGTGTFAELYAVIDRNGKPIAITPIMLGDRIPVNSVAIVDGQIVVDIMTRAAGESMADEPSVPETQTYQISVTLEQVETETP